MQTIRRLRQQRGITLIEVLIGMLILSVFLVVIYTILSRFVKTGSVGQWRSTTSASIRRAQERLRQSLDAAAYPMLITPNSNDSSAIPEHFVLIRGGYDDEGGTRTAVFGATDDDTEPSGADVVIMSWIQGSPGRFGLGALPDKDVECVQTEIILRNPHRVNQSDTYSWVQDLYLRRIETNQAPGSFDPAVPYTFSGTPKETLMVRDVNEVRVSVQSEAFDGTDIPDATSAEKKPSVNVRFICVETFRGHATLNGEVLAQPNARIMFQP